MYDVLVIGGGVIGGSILRELTKYQLKVCLLEKENDVSMGQSKANSGIVHAGFDAVPNSLKAKFNVLGNKMMPAYAKELGVKYFNNGSIVVANDNEEMLMLKELKERGKQNGVEGLEIIDREQLLAMEKNISDLVVGALIAPTAGIVCPYELTIASIGNAMDNGATLKTNFNVVKVTKDEHFTLYSENGDSVSAKIVINCAGLNSGKISAICGDDSFTVNARKGEYILLDRESGDFVSHTLFRTPGKGGKGILLSNTVDGNILIGPTAEEIDGNSTDTTLKGLEKIKEKALETVKNIPHYNTITSFTGVRAYSNRHDFIIEESKAVKNLINVAGIESPGLTSAPAIAKYVVEELVSKNIELKENKNFNGTRKPDYFFKNLSAQEKNQIIKENPAYGKIVCRCEQITEGEIIRAIRENPKATDVDAVKRRTRAGMGRCQGGFCQIRVAELIASELQIPFEQVTKKGNKSFLTVGKTK